MSYSSTALIALVVLIIVNFDVLRNSDPVTETSACEEKSYRSLLRFIALFHVFDAIWGVLYDAHLIPLVFLDTELYFVTMMASIFMMTRYVIEYLKESNGFIRFLRRAGDVFLVFESVLILLNMVFPFLGGENAGVRNICSLFWFDDGGNYHAGGMRYVTLALQIAMFLLSAGYMFITADGKESNRRRHHLAIGTYGITMAVMVIMQTVYPLLPMYSIGCLFGTCILHTFVLLDQKEERRSELEEMIHKDQELGAARQMAYRDSLTGVNSANAYAEEELNLDRRIENGDLQDFGVVVFDVNDLKRTNDTRGHEAGDDLLRDSSQLIRDQFKRSPVYRIGGDEFVVVLEGEDFRDRESLLAEFEKTVDRNREEGLAVVSSGIAVYRPGEDHSYRRVFERADRKMYDRKSALKRL